MEASRTTNFRGRGRGREGGAGGRGGGRDGGSYSGGGGGREGGGYSGGGGGYSGGGDVYSGGGDVYSGGGGGYSGGGGGYSGGGGGYSGGGGGREGGGGYGGGGGGREGGGAGGGGGREGGAYGGRGRGREGGGAGGGGGGREGGRYGRGRGREGGGGGRGRDGGGRGRGFNEQRFQPSQNEQQQGNQGWRPASTGRGSAQPPPPNRAYRPVPPPDRKPLQAAAGSGWSSGEAAKPPASSTDAIEKRLGAVSISEQQIQSSSSSSTSENNLVPVKRPDNGSRAGKPIRLLVNHFPVTYNPNSTIIHYHLDVNLVSSSNQPVKRLISKADLALIREKLFSDDPVRFPLDQTAYDGEKSIFSNVVLPTGQFEVNLLDGDRVVPRVYMIDIRAVNELKLSKLKDYFKGSLPYIPRDILQGMDLLVKDNPSRTRISSGRSFYSKELRRGDDFHNGVAAYRGFQQGLKPTGQGLVLCLDFCVMPFHKPMPVLEFLMEHVRGFRQANDVLECRRYVIESLKGLKVRVTHRRTKQKYTVMGLSNESTRDIFFDLEDIDGNNPSRRVSLVDYFREKYDYEIMHQQIPSLDIGRGKRRNYVPLELCEVEVGQRYPKEYLNKNQARLLKDLSLPPPMERKKAIIDIVRGQDGPRGVVTGNFEIGIAQNMTAVMGRVLTAPYLKLASQDGQARKVSVDNAKAHWNLTDKSVSEGKSLDQWALIDFGTRLDTDGFIMKLKNRCGRLGMRIGNPAVVRGARMQMLSSVDSLEKFLNGIVQEAGRACSSKLQMIVCAMADKHDGYKYLKWLETRMGVVTLCCLSELANKANDQYLANLALKINAKLGGSNAELVEGVPYFRDDDHVMFIGADVNHPPAKNDTCPSIAAVVGSINWPVANKYAARISPQTHRMEKINKFGAMCLELVNAYYRCNGAMPLKIVLFRDGVSEGQFDMVLNRELLDMKKTFEERNYYPMITVVVAQKRHQTRLFLDGNDVGGRPLGNVPPGTVVDSTVVHPFEFDFYCVSHYGGLGTSKPTHYYCLWDENSFTSESLQKLVYYLCFTFARCTKPVSLVPPVYYADLVAYRGRLFQEVEMERSSSSFDPSFYNQHPDLNDIMFFV